MLWIIILYVFFFRKITPRFDPLLLPDRTWGAVVLVDEELVVAREAHDLRPAVAWHLGKLKVSPAFEAFFVRCVFKGKAIVLLSCIKSSKIPLISFLRVKFTTCKGNTCSALKISI